MLKQYQIILIILVFGFTSCIRDSKKPGRQYMADMVTSTAYDASSPNPVYKDGKTNHFSPEGSLARGKYIYPLADTDYVKAATAITNTFVFSKEEIEGQGKHLYTINCSICHGDKGDGQGYLVEINKYPPPPSYYSDDLMKKPEGQRYHTLMYGKGLMGSYASQLDNRERWLVLAYVKGLQDASKTTTTANADSTKTK